MIIYFLFILSYIVIIFFGVIYDLSKKKRDFRYAEFWQSCSEKKARKAMHEIFIDPNLNIQTYQVITDMGLPSTPIIEAAKANNFLIVDMLIHSGCDPFKQVVLYEDDFGKPVEYHCAAVYAYNSKTPKPELVRMMERHKEYLAHRYE